ncbi:hypothetical protein M9Y10_005847 [Tritrichomonas musculus]|uniref:Ribonucleoside-diphosphate reductase n=1 Tax=Tritrichomonas musculus TaxID=1915356 RepID=A0ABR2JDS6_9EUKA
MSFRQEVKYVIKRSGSKEAFSIQKVQSYLNKIIKDSKLNIKTDQILQQLILSIDSEIEKSSKILEILISITSNMISYNTDCQFLAARLFINSMRQEVWKSYTPKNSLYDRVKQRSTEYDVYDPIILEKYTEKEFNMIESEIVDYSRDYLLTYSGMRQFYDKYLFKNRLTNQLYELPQEANILIPMYVFMNQEPTKRMEYIKIFYHYLSTLVISLPTPIYSGVRTHLKQFSSCCVIDCDDTIDSILATNYIIGKTVTKRYGLGINIGKIRGIGAGVKKDTIVHNGIVPFLKMFESSMKGFMQNGIRGGCGTISFPFWHWEVAALIELKNNKGVQENRVRGLDYSIGLNRFFLERAKTNSYITLFSSEEVPELVSDYTYSYEQFKQIYTKYENTENIRKQKINALSLLMKIATERYETGRIYIYFMDNMNYYSVFKESIFSSNLCQEICLPTKPVYLSIANDDNHSKLKNDYHKDEYGLISVCILSCINIGRVCSISDELSVICEIIVRFLDELIDYQHYCFDQIKLSAVDYRPLGIGISDLFHLLAKNKLKYNSPETFKFVHELVEQFQFYLLTASCKLAEEKGRCKRFNCSKYSDCILPIDNYKDTLDSYANFNYICDWESLRERIRKFGLRNCCLSSIPPTASSCSISNSTPGIDPPRTKTTFKMSKYGTFAQVIPDLNECERFYTFQKDILNKDYFKLIGIIQKFIDQGISTNSFYMSNDDVSIGDVVKEIYDAYNYGLKSLYYLNNNKGVDDDVSQINSAEGINVDFNEINDGHHDDICSSGACSI